MALFLYARHYTRNIPYLDDWEMVPVITGHESISLSGLPHSDEELEVIASGPVKIRYLEPEETQFLQSLGYPQELTGSPNSAVRVDILSRRAPAAKF